MNKSSKLKLQLFLVSFIVLYSSSAIVFLALNPNPDCKEEIGIFLGSEEIEPEDEAIIHGIELPYYPCDPALDSSICYSPKLQEDLAEPISEICNQKIFFPGKRITLCVLIIMIIYLTMLVVALCYKSILEYMERAEKSDQIPEDACNKRVVVFNFGPFDDSDYDSDFDVYTDSESEDDGWC